MFPSWKSVGFCWNVLATPLWWLCAFVHWCVLCWWFLNGEPPLHSWDKYHLVMVYDTVYMLLGLVRWNILEDFCCFIHRELGLPFSCDSFVWFWCQGIVGLMERELGKSFIFASCFRLAQNTFSSSNNTRICFCAHKSLFFSFLIPHQEEERLRLSPDRREGSALGNPFRGWAALAPLFSLHASPSAGCPPLPSPLLREGCWWLSHCGLWRRPLRPCCGRGHLILIRLRAVSTPEASPAAPRLGRNGLPLRAGGHVSIPAAVPLCGVPKLGR